MKLLVIFAGGNPLIWFVVIAVIFLLFGASRLPKIARALGESKRALKDGLSDNTYDTRSGRESLNVERPPLSIVEDEVLFAEVRRRSSALTGVKRGAGEKS